MNYETELKTLPIKQWAEDDRPREKLMLKGLHALSDAELLAILIATGTRDESAVELSKKILSLTNHNLNELGKLQTGDFKKIKGIGEAKALTLIAALELGRRRKTSESVKRMQIASSKDSFDWFYPLISDLPHEEFWVLLLNRNNRCLQSRKVSEGGVSGTLVDSKILFKYALENLASSIVLCHNHPSGNTKPSEADLQLTRKLTDAAKLLDILIIDHVIIGDKTYFSFADEGLL